MFANCIISELKKLENQNFTGHIRFGVEFGKVKTMSLCTKIDLIPDDNEDWQSTIKKICENDSDFFGSVEFNMSFGRITSHAVYITIQGEQLDKRLERCRNVRVVVKK